MKLTLVSVEDGLTRVRSAGDITLEDVHTNREPLGELLGPEGYGRRVLLSLEGSCFIDSGGVGWLVMCDQRFRKAGGRLVVHSLPPMVNHVFELLQIPTILNVARDAQGAVQLAQQEQ
jgi:anti-anti-sigma factor